MILKTKTMSVKEFQSLGLLQELNRLFLHPRGLAMAVTIDDQFIALGPIYDYRDEPEGVEFARGDIDTKAVRAVAELKAERLAARLALPDTDSDGIQKSDSDWSPDEVEI